MSTLASAPEIFAVFDRAPVLGTGTGGLLLMLTSPTTAAIASLCVHIIMHKIYMPKHATTNEFKAVLPLM